jgi:serine/threonine protein kinase/tetratricopeptide (TPR) repeat protein
MVGQRISQYEIIEKIGEGGMGVVYKAMDHNRERLVALKLLSARTNPSAEEAHRFEQEARAALTLDHPNIAAVHDRGAHEGRPYLVFEYLPGGSLRDKLRGLRAAGERLPVEDALRYGVEIAAGLAYAHRKGVVHRDVRPENVLLSEDGCAKVSDFGLALWNDAARVTTTGSTLGTAAYTSPEQAQQLTVDHRADIFSFGVVLYELVAGESPFPGDYAAAVVYEVVNTPTPSLRQVRPDVPEALDRIVQKATAKEPGARYRHMGELLIELRELWNDPLSVRAETRTRRRGKLKSSPRRKTEGARRTALLIMAAVLAVLLALAGLYSFGGRFRGPAEQAGTPPISPAASVSIAVLPFENLSRDASQDYLADGITEALITSLAKIPSLRVISRTSVMRYRQGGKTARAIGKELNVTRVVEGSVMHVGNEIRVTAQLIDAGTEDHLWAESYQRDLVDVLSLQQDVALAIAAEVQANLANASPLPPGQTAPVNPAAYAAWIRGRILAYQWTPKGIEDGIASFHRAIELDPNYAPGHAGLAMAYGFEALLDLKPPGESWPRARAAAEQALKLDPSLSDAYTVLGFVQSSYDWNWSGAEELYQRALELNPGSSDAHLGYAMTGLAPAGRLDEALVHMQKSVELDPLSAVVNMAQGHLYLFRREQEQAIRQYQHTIEIDPTFPEARMNLGFIYIMKGDTKQAAAAFQGLPDTRLDLEVLSHILGGRRGEALGALERLEELSGVHYVSAVDLAALNLLVGRKQHALDLLEQGFQDRATDMMFLKVSPVYDPIRLEPRFQELLRKMNLL